MKKSTWVQKTLILAVCALALASAAKALELVPFKGTRSGTVTITGVSGPIVTHASTWSGKATHLGLFTGVSRGDVNAVTGTSKDTKIFTAANGDLLFVTAVGQFTDLNHAVETCTITDGTGRFAGATGTFTLYHELFRDPNDPLHNTFTDEFEGTISSVGGSE